MRTITLKEHQSSRPEMLSVSERDALSDLVPSLVIQPVKGCGATYTLTPDSTIGAVFLDELAVVIEPKIPIHRVLFLLSYSLDPKNWRQSSFEFGTSDSLVEAVVLAFASQLEKALHRGMLQGYRSADDSLATIRGHIRFAEQIRRRNGSAPPVEVTFDDFTEDILENRLLKAALARLRRMKIRSPHSQLRLRRFEQMLTNVEVQSYSRHAVPVVTYTRLNKHYQRAVELARLILRNISLELAHGRHRGCAMLVDMNEAFENFVVIALREALGLSERQFPQGLGRNSLALDNASRVQLAPDLSWWEGGKCKFIGDVKYKRVNAAGIKHPDLYQLLAYTTAADLPKGLLIYAAGQGDSALHEVVNLGKRLHVVSIDLQGSPQLILAEITRLAGWIRLSSSSVR
jgi:5-methylcytosine-specific restriction enzyme subunit McrC